MKVIFAFLVGAISLTMGNWVVVNQDGSVADTPEVAAVKAARLSELVKAGGDVPASYFASVSPTVPETPEVIAAKKAHFEAYQEALRRAETTDTTKIPNFGQALPSSFVQTPGVWRGPEAPLNADGTVGDTEEVKQEKERHFAAFPGNAYIKQTFKNQKGEIIENAPLNRDGTVADTSEILSRKQEHFNAHKEAINRLKFFK